MTSSPVEGVKKKLPHIPWTELGLPVTIDILLGLVKLGIALFTNKSSPFFFKASILGIKFNFDACSKYSFWLPSKQITIAVVEGIPG